MGNYTFGIQIYFPKNIIIKCDSELFIGSQASHHCGKICFDEFLRIGLEVVNKNSIFAHSYKLVFFKDVMIAKSFQGKQ
ncbi:hypothetical protein D3C87_1307360 [compost metagenome]